jgi:hypothetical protein
MNSIDNIEIATTKKIFEVINHIAKTIIIGKLKKITKLKITLKFNKNIKKYNFIVLFGFKIVIFAEVHIDLKTFLLSMIITYFAYDSKILNNIQRKNSTINV